ncbi:MAG TPA: DUF5678 domain-containing protein [Pyrinomonadaceae bacterium]|nr:DUF5678 domain-containing protein [Pyrinomonadaceae bacterium]
MVEEQDIDSNFPEIIGDFENKWVAIAEVNGKETVVGSGDDATEATREAKARGSFETFLFKVPSFHVSYAP